VSDNYFSKTITSNGFYYYSAKLGMVSFSHNWPVGRREKTMPTEIVAETCPAPEGNLTPRDVKQFVKELTAYDGRFKAAFRRPEQFQRAAIYLRGLLGDAPRTTIEPMALALGENVRNLQHFIGQNQCGTEPAGQIHQALIGDTRGRKMAWR
jgi:hypothetical protein